MKITNELKEKEAYAIDSLYKSLPLHMVSVMEKPLSKLCIKHNITPLSIGKVLYALSTFGLVEILGARGRMNYRRTQDRDLTTLEILQVVDKIHLLPKLTDLTILRSQRGAGRTKNGKIETPKISEPVECKEPPTVKKDTEPSCFKPKEESDLLEIQGQFGKRYFFITPNNTIGYGRLETIQAIFDQDTILGYRYELVNKEGSHIVEKLYTSVIQASQEII